MEKPMQTNNEKGSRLAATPLILAGAEIAVLFLPLIFLTAPLLRLTDSEALAWLLSVAPQVIAAVVSCLVMLDRSARQAMLKWIFSLPFSALFWVYLVNSRFLIRLYNYVDPSFGSGLEGSTAGIAPVLGTALVAGGIGVAAGMFLSQYRSSPKLRKTALVMQKTLCPILCSAVFIAVTVLSIIMPDYISSIG